jgi:hypothetical protein
MIKIMTTKNMTIPLLGLFQGVEVDRVRIGGFPAVNHCRLVGKIVEKGRPGPPGSDLTAAHFLPEGSTQPVEVYELRSTVDLDLSIPSSRRTTVVTGSFAFLDDAHQGLFVEESRFCDHVRQPAQTEMELTAVIQEAGHGHLLLKPLAVGWSDDFTVVLEPADRDDRFAEGQIIHIEHGTLNPVGHHLEGLNRALTCRPEHVEILRKPQPDDPWDRNMLAVEIDGVTASNSGCFAGRAEAFTGNSEVLVITLLTSNRDEIPLYAHVRPDLLHAGLEQSAEPLAFEGFFRNGDFIIDRAPRPWRQEHDAINELILGGSLDRVYPSLNEDLWDRYRNDARLREQPVLRYGHDAQRVIFGLDPVSVAQIEPNAVVSVPMEYRDGYWIPKERHVRSLSTP